MQKNRFCQKQNSAKSKPWIPTFAGIQGFFSVPWAQPPQSLFLHAPQRYAGGNGQVVNPGLKGIAGLGAGLSAGQYALHGHVIAFQKLAGAAEGAVTALDRK